MNWNYWVHYALYGKEEAENSLKPYKPNLHIEAQKLELAKRRDPDATLVEAYRASDGSLHPSREEALDVSRRAAYRDAYAKATKDLTTVAHLGGPFDRYQGRHGEWARDLVIHQILTHKDRVIRILNSIPQDKGHT